VARRRGRASCSAGRCSKTSRTAAATATGQTRWRSGGGGGARAPGRSRLRVGRNRRQGTAPGQGRHSVPGLDRAWRALRKAPRARPPGCGLTREPPSYYLRSVSAHRWSTRLMDSPLHGVLDVRAPVTLVAQSLAQPQALRKARSGHRLRSQPPWTLAYVAEALAPSVHRRKRRIACSNESVAFLHSISCCSP